MAYTAVEGEKEHVGKRRPSIFSGLLGESHDEVGL